MELSIVCTNDRRNPECRRPLAHLKHDHQAPLNHQNKMKQDLGCMRSFLTERGLSIVLKKGEGLQNVDDRSSSSTRPPVTAQTSEEELLSLLLSGSLCIILRIFSNGASKPLDLIKKLVSLARKHVFYRYNSKFSKVFRRNKLFLNLVIHFNLSFVREKSKHCKIWFCTLCLFYFFIRYD